MQVFAAKVVVVIVPPWMVEPVAAARVLAFVAQAAAVTLQSWNTAPSGTGRVGVVNTVEAAG